MTHLFPLDFINGTISASKTTLRKAGNVGTPEYKELMRLLKKHPNLAVVEKEIQQNGSKRSYKGLTMAVMEAHLKAEDAQNGTALLDEFEEFKAQVKKMEKSIYPLCKQWFLEKYPNFKVSEGQKTARKINLNEIKAKAAKKEKTNNLTTINSKPAVNQ